ncbi:MAG TPA: hypothetical protein H9837_08555 [Candidatus Brachybacterium merdigallinarum]|nr:hypothetical protein [Candidatus Brachybacterium merdigallinarum]
MAVFTASLDSALVRETAAQARADGADLNPLWQTMITVPDAPSPGAAEHDPEHAALIRRALTAPCVAAISVTPAEGPRTELEISVDGVGTVVCARRSGGEAGWSPVETETLPEIIMSLAPEGSRLAAPASMTTRSEATRLQLSSTQVDQVRSRVDREDSAQAAIEALPDLDPGLRDALTSTGDRASLAIHLIPPAPEQSVTLLRRWTSGEHGLYSADGPAGPLAGMHLVEDGDFFGTVIPLLHEGARIAQADSRAGGAA